MYTWFWWENLRESDHLGDPGVDGRIIFNMVVEVVCGGMDWIELVQVRYRWRGISGLAENRLASQEGAMLHGVWSVDRPMRSHNVGIFWK